MAAQLHDISGPVVVGVIPHQYGRVLQVAAALARRLGTELVCAYVDEASYLVEWNPERSARRLSLHPEKDDEAARALSAQLRSLLEQALEGQGVTWTLHILAGDPARALSRLAADREAAMIVVGTAQPSFGHRVSEAVNGSMAAWLTRHQRRPVLVVPHPS